MAIGVMEIATIARSQDYATMKHNENTKLVTDQSNILGHVEKVVEERAQQVKQSDNSDWQNKKFDAKEKGKGQYSGDKGKKREDDKKDGTVCIKGPGGFDIKI